MASMNSRFRKLISENLLLIEENKALSQRLNLIHSQDWKKVEQTLRTMDAEAQAYLKREREKPTWLRAPLRIELPSVHPVKSVPHFIAGKCRPKRPVLKRKRSIEPGTFEYWSRRGFKDGKVARHLWESEVAEYPLRLSRTDRELLTPTIEGSMAGPESGFPEFDTDFCEGLFTEWQSF